MTSWQGAAIRVTGILCGEGNSLTNCWTYCRVASYFSVHDVCVISLQWDIFLLTPQSWIQLASTVMIRVRPNRSLAWNVVNWSNRTCQMCIYQSHGALRKKIGCCTDNTEAKLQREVNNWTYIKLTDQRITRYSQDLIAGCCWKSFLVVPSVLHWNMTEYSPRTRHIWTMFAVAVVTEGIRSSAGMIFAMKCKWAIICLSWLPGPSQCLALIANTIRILWFHKFITWFTVLYFNMFQAIESV